MNKKYLIFTGIVIIFALIFSLLFILKRNQLFYQQKIDLSKEVINREQNQQTATNDQIQTSTGQETKKLNFYTIEEISKHNSQENCWTVIRGKVYDLTQWIDKHPGGADKILSICGKDGTQAFVQKHGDKEKPEKILKEFEIGVLKTQ
ncbi:MAG: cytochrome b5-like heme/steroid binding domain-containing protein [Candidatus Aenigmatarchaeota archaeon]